MLLPVYLRNDTHKVWCLALGLTCAICPKFRLNLQFITDRILKLFVWISPITASNVYHCSVNLQISLPQKSSLVFYSNSIITLIISFNMLLYILDFSTLSYRIRSRSTRNRCCSHRGICICFRIDGYR